MNIINTTVMLLTKARARTIRVEQLDDRLLNDIGLCRHDLRGGRLTRRGA